MDTVAATYIDLAHAIEQYSPGYIDGYYGPPRSTPTEKQPLDELSSQANQLAATIAALDDASRRMFLEAQVRAMQTSIRLLQGEPIPYAEEVRLLYDVEPERTPEHVFDEALAQIDELLPGEGTLAERMQALRHTFVVPAERLPDLSQHVISELAARTQARFPLPDGESFNIQLVRNEPWSAYNWYLGNYQSRIDINTDRPNYLSELPDLLAHEGYPGHHTEHVLKEQRLLREQNRFEHSILLINSPECVISEGIATRALQMIMSEAELLDWFASDLLARADLQHADIRTYMAVEELHKNLRRVSTNAALMVYEDGASDDEAIAYVQRYSKRTLEEAQGWVQFIRHPTFRSYLFTYTCGGELLDALFARGNAATWFGRVLHEPVTPEQLRAWAASEQGDSK